MWQLLLNAHWSGESSTFGKFLITHNGISQDESGREKPGCIADDDVFRRLKINVRKKGLIYEPRVFDVWQIPHNSSLDLTFLGWVKLK